MLSNRGVIAGPFCFILLVPTRGHIFHRWCQGVHRTLALPVEDVITGLEFPVDLPMYVTARGYQQDETKKKCHYYNLDDYYILCRFIFFFSSETLVCIFLKLLLLTLQY